MGQTPLNSDTRKTSQGLHYVKTFDLLASPPKNEFTQLTRLSARLLDVPIAQVCLVADDGLRFFSFRDDAEAGRPVDHSICARTLSDPDNPTVVCDATQTDTIDPAEVSFGEDSYRAYADTPLEVEGTLFGVLCVRDRKPRQFTEDQLQDLRALGSQVTTVVERRQARRQSKTLHTYNDDHESPRRKPEKTEEHFQDLIEQAPIGFLLCDEDFEFIHCNNQACEQLGYDRDELLNKTVIDINPEFDSPEEIRAALDDLEPGDLTHIESVHESKNGDTFLVSVHVRKTPPGIDGYLMGWISDISERKQHERELRRTRNRLRKIIDLAPVAITGITQDGKVEIWNPAAEELYGWSREEITGRKLSELENYMPDSLRDQHERLREKTMGGATIQNHETRRRTKSGEELEVLLSTSVVEDRHGDPEIALGIIQDISELKRTQRELQQALDEKANLLREVHHRVKNNLQVIKSLLNLYDRNSQKSPGAMLEECRNRIQTMAMVHDMLYQSGDLAKLPFDEYAEELIATILSLNDFPDSTTEVTLNLDASIQLPVSRAFPCGLIIHELVSNACQHAFTKNTHNRLIVDLTEKNNQLVIRVRDNGPGLPEDVDPEETESTGFEILRSLVEYELDGTMRVSSEPMTTFEVRFSLDRTNA